MRCIKRERKENRQTVRDRWQRRIDTETKADPDNQNRGGVKHETKSPPFVLH